MTSEVLDRLCTQQNGVLADCESSRIQVHTDSPRSW